MEDNSLVFKHRWHIKAREELARKRFIWPSSLPDLNPVGTIWLEMKTQFRGNFTIGAIRELVEQEWKPVNHPIMSMSSLIQAGIADDSGFFFCERACGRSQF